MVFLKELEKLADDNKHEKFPRGKRVKRWFLKQWTFQKVWVYDLDELILVNNKWFTEESKKKATQSDQSLMGALWVAQGQTFLQA